MNDDRGNLGTDPSSSDLHSEAPPTILCWRCGKTISAEFGRCPLCAAPAAHQALPLARQADSLGRDAQALSRTLATFAVLLGVSLVARLIDCGAAYASAQPSPGHSGQVLLEIFVLEGIDTGLVLAVWFWIGGCYLEPRRSLLRRLCAWGFALPALAAALVFNHEYHRLLQEWLHVIPIDYIFVQDRSHFAGWLICICVQPALIEELFFRYLAFGSLRAVMGGHAVVWVTAVMFASAHIGVVLSLPVLFVLGLLLGYARLASGGMLLPVVLHFLHNLCVIALHS